MMDRREVLKTTTVVAGFALSGSAFTILLQGCRTEPKHAEAALDVDWSPEFFDHEQIDLIAELAETILPETDTPGAKAAMVHAFIDEEVRYMYAEEDQQRFLEGLKDVQERAFTAYGKTFQTCSADERATLLRTLEQKASEEDNERFFPMLKEMTFFGYYSSEKIGEEVLQYDPIPGVYHGCTDMIAEDRIWSL